jgi:hypothetical protein
MLFTFQYPLLSFAPLHRFPLVSPSNSCPIIIIIILNIHSKYKQKTWLFELGLSQHEAPAFVVVEMGSS